MPSIREDGIYEVRGIRARGSHTRSGDPCIILTYATTKGVVTEWVNAWNSKSDYAKQCGLARLVGVLGSRAYEPWKNLQAVVNHINAAGQFPEKIAASNNDGFWRVTWLGAHR